MLHHRRGQLEETIFTTPGCGRHAYFNSNCHRCNDRAQTRALQEVAGHFERVEAAQRTAEKSARREDRRARRGGGLLWDEKLRLGAWISGLGLIGAAVAVVLLILALILAIKVFLYLLPFLMLAAIGYLVWRHWGRRRAETIAQAASPGWYPDPWGAPTFRWFDGGSWTEQLRDQG